MMLILAIMTYLVKSMIKMVTLYKNYLFDLLEQVRKTGYHEDTHVCRYL